MKKKTKHYLGEPLPKKKAVGLGPIYSRNPAEEGEKAARKENADRELQGKSFTEKLQDPRVHIAARKFLGALRELDRYGLKVTDWFFDDSGCECEFEDLNSLDKKWIKLGK